MKYILVAADGRVMLFSVIDCARLYQGIYGGKITAINDGVTKQII